MISPKSEDCEDVRESATNNESSCTGEETLLEPLINPNETFDSLVSNDMEPFFHVNKKQKLSSERSHEYETDDECSRLLMVLKDENIHQSDKNNAESSPVRIQKKTFRQLGIFLFGSQYIEKKQSLTKNIDQLHLSACFTHENMNIILHNEGCLMATENNFVAQVKISCASYEKINDSINFLQAKRILLNGLRIVRVLIDDFASQQDGLSETLLVEIRKSISSSSMDRFKLFQILSSLIEQKNESVFDLYTAIVNSRLESKELTRTASELIKLRHLTERRNRILSRFNYRPKNYCPYEIDKLRTEVVESHRKFVLEKAPQYLLDALNDVDHMHLMLIKNEDVKLFADMANVLDDKVFQRPLQELATRWVERVKISTRDTKSPLTNPIVFFLCKSLYELIAEMSVKTKMTIAELLISDATGWHPADKITWKNPSDLTKCLEREYFFIFQLLEHFDIGAKKARTAFKYKLKFFEDEEQSSVLQSTVERVKGWLVSSKPTINPFGIADELYVWYCLLDDIFYHVLPANGKNLRDWMENIIQTYIGIIREAGREKLETVRIMTRNTARFVIQSSPFITHTDANELDRRILQNQLEFVSLNATSSRNFSDVMDIFNVFWKNKNEIVDQISSKIDLPEMAQVKSKLLEIIFLALKKRVDISETVEFFRTYNDFLVDLNDLSFDWLIKDIPGANMSDLILLKLIVPISNKWTETRNRTCRVLEPKKFIKFIGSYYETVSPKHYVVEIISILLTYMHLQLDKREWVSSETLSDHDQIKSGNELIFAVRNSLLYLKNQENYVSFEQFYLENVQPFANVVNGSISSKDFSTRMHLIKESFWFIRKQNEIDIDQALELYRKLNISEETTVLLKIYRLYSDHYQKYMQLHANSMEYNHRAEFVAKAVKECVEIKQFKCWNKQFKQEQMPKILAGLAAVWSILVSKDVSSSGQYLGPHCIQILCIFRLLGVDRTEDGVINHLAQVLTGQGKSLVLALTAAILALTGHNVRVVCYSKYLVARDKQDFQQLLTVLDIKNNIVYGTFDDMANQFINPAIVGKKVNLRDLVTNLIMKSNSTEAQKFESERLDNSVLLIDEVDVFFTKDFYGASYLPTAVPFIPGLDQIQEKIWMAAKEGNSSVEIDLRIKEFMKSPNFIHRENMQKFLHKSGHYQLLESKHNSLILRLYTNQSLFQEHLIKMIICAIEVYEQPASHWANHKLSSDGKILLKRREEYGYSISEYYTTFNYFRLKKTHFAREVSGHVNYGYLIITCGSLSYAMLPQNYPLILGVSGTLTSLNRYEKQSMKNIYKIHKQSTMPTFFGCSNLKFDEVIDFQCHNNETAWLNHIFSRSNAVISSKRSVLVFFENDIILDKFHTQYVGQFDRLNVLTENTDDRQKQQFINEAGVANTITLATRGMGRGVDYKSSVAVEKNGGVHVIQTFFSQDIKEETQIKGRTARKDNQGSYELIVCKSHLNKIINCSSLDGISYKNLDSSRNVFALQENERILNSVQNAENSHRITMTYMKSFFK
ncbi:uncharacterized protein LOC131434316 [Malaya genurostris]|uniref:uncharacterized protein LOC131434316 n=1 Tax=Malaya genurostris TaxID=325434 RepID=UPI0026F403CD|nr:uncharacterized protein LOC131434316 [Malaya genurostris]